MFDLVWIFKANTKRSSSVRSPFGENRGKIMNCLLPKGVLIVLVLASFGTNQSLAKTTNILKECSDFAEKFGSFQDCLQYFLQPENQHQLSKVREGSVYCLMFVPIQNT